MALNVKKVSQLNEVSYSTVDGSALFYIATNTGNKSYNIQLSNLFLATNNLSSFKFASDTFTISEGSLNATGTLNVQSIVSNVSGNEKSTYAELINIIYPIGSIYISTLNTNPNILFGVGTWVAWGSGKVPVGINTLDSNFNISEKTGGSADAVVVTHNHTATTNITDPSHSHTTQNGQSFITGYGSQNDADGYGGGSGYDLTNNTANASTGITASTSITGTGESGTNKNLQPYIVCYMWKRTA